MAVQNINIKEITRLLTSQISVGWNYFVIAKFIREAYEEDRIKGSHTIFTNSYSACWDAAILSVTKVLDKQNDSINIKYLLNCIEGSSINYPSLTKDEIKQQIINHRVEINSIEESIPGIWDERDRIVTHLDRKHVNDPANVFSNPRIELDDLHSSIRALRRILLTYNTQLKAEGISIDENQYIWDDLERLIRLIDDENARTA